MSVEAELISEISDDAFHEMDDDQLAEFKVMLKQLGAYPDMVIINTLSMIASDYSVSFPESCKKNLPCNSGVAAVQGCSIES